MSNEEPPAPMDIPLDHIIEAPWNVNVMDPETFLQLATDMKANGLRSINPISVAPATQVLGEPYKGYVTIDGAQKLRAAKELGWTSIPSFIHREITTEAQARLFNYRRDAERGQIDPYKLAQSFKWFQDKGKNQEDIAKEFGIDRSTVARRLSLLNLDEKVKTKLMKEEGATISHLEPISTLTKDQQRVAVDHLDEYTYGGTVTVKAVQNLVDAIKKQQARKEGWLETVAKSKFPKCPKCKQDPVSPNDYYSVGTYLSCGQNHHWNRTTGKTPNEESLERMRPEDRPTGRTPPKEPKIPQHVKTSHKVDEYEAAMWPFLKKKWDEVKNVDSCSFSGTLKNGENFNLTYNGYHFSYSDGSKKNEVEFAVEEISSKAYNKEGLFTRVKPQEGMAQGLITNREQLRRLANITEKFIQDYGKTPRTNEVIYKIEGGGTLSWIPAATDKNQQRLGNPKK